MALTEVKRFLKDVAKDKQLLEKLERFADNHIDLYTRFCVRPGCEGRMRSENLNTKKMVCPDCQQAVCYLCREAWHGYYTSCESAFSK